MFFLAGWISGLVLVFFGGVGSLWWCCCNLLGLCAKRCDEDNQEEQRKGKDEKISVLLSYSAINWQREE